MSKIRIALNVAIFLWGSFVFPNALQAASFYGTGHLPSEPTELYVSGLSTSGEYLLGRARQGSGDAAIFFGEKTLSLTTGNYEIGGGAVYSEAIDRVRTANGQLDYIVGHSEGSTAREVWFETFDVPGDSSISNGVVQPYPNSTYDNEARGIGRNQRILIQTSAPGIQNAVFYQPESGAFTDLGWQRANAIDLEGTRIVGVDLNNISGYREAALRDDTYGVSYLGILSGGTSSEAHGISANGRNIVGTSDSLTRSGSLPQAFRWHADLGMRALTPIVDGGYISTAYDVDDSGNTIVGTYGISFNMRAFIWTPASGRVDLKNYLTTTYGLGNELGGWLLIDANHISANGRIIAGTGVNPLGQYEGFIIDLDGAQPATVKLRPVAPDASPSQWDLYVECGDFPIRELYFGLILPKSFSLGDTLKFAQCNDGSITPGQLHCTGSSQLGPTVSTNSSITIPYVTPLSAPDQRADTVYFHLIGQGGPMNHQICAPGDAEAYLGPFELPDRDPELIRSAFDGSHGKIDDTNFIQPEDVDFVREGLLPRTEVRLQPTLDDTNGTRFDVILDSEVSYGCFSFAIIVPPLANIPVFGGCTVAEPGGFEERSCLPNPDLGANLATNKVRTIGPAGDLGGSPIRDDAIYVYVEGTLDTGGALTAVNLPNQPAHLGVFEFTDILNPGFGYSPALTADGLPDLDIVWNQTNDWCDDSEHDVMVNVRSVQFSVIGLPGGDSDGDSIEDSWDPCPYVPSSIFLDDSGTLAQSTSPPIYFDRPDGIGNECQCGDHTGNGYVQSSDLLELRAGLLDPSVAGTLNQTLTCNSVGPIDYEIDPATGLPRDCEVNDLYVLMQAQYGTGPLVPTPGSPVSCPDVIAPPP